MNFISSTMLNINGNLLIFLILLQSTIEIHFVTDDGSERALLQLQMQLESTIFVTRQDVIAELNTLDNLLDYLRQKIDERAELLHSDVENNQIEAKSANKSIKHCINGLKILATNLDLYNLHQCKEIKCHVQDTFVEAKEISLKLTKNMSYCRKYYRTVDMRRCFRKVHADTSRNQRRVLRKLQVIKSRVFVDGLTCVQNNYNIILNELCVLMCQFEECVKKQCNRKKLN